AAVPQQHDRHESRTLASCGQEDLLYVAPRELLGTHLEARLAPHPEVHGRSCEQEEGIVDRTTLRGAVEKPDQTVEARWMASAQSGALTDLVTVVGITVAVLAF